jgi:translation initiation factor IF-2
MLERSDKGESLGGLESVLDVVEEAAAGILDEAEAEAARRIAEAESRAEEIAREKTAELTMLTDTMLSHARSVNARADDLLKAIDEAMADLENLIGSGSARGESGESGESGKSPLATAPASSSSETGSAAGPAEPAAGPAEPAAERPAARDAEPLRALRERLSQIGRPPRQVQRPAASAPARQPSTPDPPAATPPTAGRSAKSSGAGPSEGAILLATQMAVAGGSREQIEERLRNDFGIEDPGSILDGLGN